MQDVLVKIDDTGLYDLVIESGDFKAANGFETAIPISLFTDARAESFQVQNSQKRRGWAGNIQTIGVNFELGSQLWVYDQSRNTALIRNNVRNEVQSSLQWFIDRGIAAGIQVRQLANSIRGILIPIIFTRIDNIVDQYVTLWRRTDADQLPND